jgi:hypothetical protein
LFSSIRTNLKSGKNLPNWRPFSQRDSIHNLKPAAKAIMQTFLSLLAMAEPSPQALMVLAAISLGLLAIFLRYKLG